MNTVRIPDNTLKILKLLNASGCEAMVVGGCVRDSLMGRTPYDWDITTSATPSEMKEVFSGYKVIETGIKHGTLTVVDSEGEMYEITTFRIDGEYKDNRHPETVEFVRDLEGDLARRDFTMNAIACDAEGNLSDPFGGIDDIREGIIRCVGDPDKRFNEDGLRILRALRFASVLGFKIEERTDFAIRSGAGLIDNIAAERIRVELLKLLKGRYSLDVLTGYKEVITRIIPELIPCIGFEQHSIWHCFDVYDHTMHAVASYEGEDDAIKMALLLHDIGKPSCFSTDDEGNGHFYGHAKESVKIAEKVVDRLRFSNADKDQILPLIRYHDLQMGTSPKACRRIRANYGPDLLIKLAEVKKADNMAQSGYAKEKESYLVEESFKVAREIASSDSCFDLKSLAVSGDDLMETFGLEEGRKVGMILNALLANVIDGEIPNDKDKLLDLARSLIAED